MEARPEVNDVWSKTIGFAPQGPCFVASFCVCLINALPFLFMVWVYIESARGEVLAGMCSLLSRYRWRNVGFVVVLIRGGAALFAAVFPTFVGLIEVGTCLVCRRFSFVCWLDRGRGLLLFGTLFPSFAGLPVASFSAWPFSFCALFRTVPS